MPKGANMQKRTGTFDRETACIVEEGFISASQVRTALGIRNFQIWKRTLAAAGITPVERGHSGHHYLAYEDARRLLAGAQADKPP